MRSFACHGQKTMTSAIRTAEATQIEFALHRYDHYPNRPGDTFGLLGNLVGASSQQQAFLKAGGTGILNGDGNLSYACEKSIETYYDIALAKNCHLAADYQFFADPAFNRDRGPVNVFQGRLHWDY